MCDIKRIRIRLASVNYLYKELKMFNVKILVLVVLLSLTGCSVLGSAVGKAAKVNDDVLKAAEFSICNGASVGSVKRRFNTPELAKLWRELCEEKQGFSL